MHNYTSELDEILSFPVSCPASGFIQNVDGRKKTVFYFIFHFILIHLKRQTNRRISVQLM